jgi:hypothetical protein
VEVIQHFKDTAIAIQTGEPALTRNPLTAHIARSMRPCRFDSSVPRRKTKHGLRAIVDQEKIN